MLKKWAIATTFATHCKSSVFCFICGFASRHVVGAGLATGWVETACLLCGGVARSARRRHWSHQVRRKYQYVRCPASGTRRGATLVHKSVGSVLIFETCGPPAEKLWSCGSSSAGFLVGGRFPYYVNQFSVSVERISRSLCEWGLAGWLGERYRPTSVATRLLQLSGCVV